MGCWCLKRPNVSVKRSQASNYFAKVTEPKTRIRSILLLQLLLRYINNTWTKASRQKPITAYPFPGLRSPKTRINLQDIVPNDFFTWNLSSSYVTLAFGDMSSSPWSLLWRVDNILGRPRKKSVSASGGWSKNGLEKSDNLWGWCGKDWRDSKGWKNDFSKSQKDFCLCSIQSVKLSLPPDKPLLLLLFNEVVSLKELSFESVFVDDAPPPSPASGVDMSRALIAGDAKLVENWSKNWSKTDRSTILQLSNLTELCFKMTWFWLTRILRVLNDGSCNSGMFHYGMTHLINAILKLFDYEFPAGYRVCFQNAWAVSMPVTRVSVLPILWQW